MMLETREHALATALRERGQRATPQRLAIARVLADLDRHVTAERVHAEVSSRMPGVSLPTVYATLDLLEELGLAQRVATEGGAVVYDPRTDEHHHLVCRACGAIMDVDVPVDTAGIRAAALASGFRPDASQVVLRGLCADCAELPAVSAR
jgi:Fur family ferric uptake transcriptional regulator/Fur family peroxide stress response transcriptional regulator